MFKRVYLTQNVFDAALERIDRLYDEFPNVVVSCSGGKDSTVAFHLTHIVAKRRGRLPLKLFWLDQETEWQHVVDHVRGMMSRIDVEPYWFQGPFRMSDNTSSGHNAFLEVWKDGAEWMRPKEPNSIHVNITGEDRFEAMFNGFTKTYFKNTPTAMIGGVRCEESPARRMSLSNKRIYKDISWGKILDRSLNHYTFYPIYDWTWRDVWKAIHDNKWPYCKIYDYMYQYGIQVMDMRVSSVHHESSMRWLKVMQEIEPKTWERLVKRLGTVNTVSQAWDLYKPPSELPFMFKTWDEYAEYLLEKLTPADQREKLRVAFRYAKSRIADSAPKRVWDSFGKSCVASILVGDFGGVKMKVFVSTLNAEWDNRKSRKNPTGKAVVT
jgi:predicted phosphoadenosine phosphosulfate sulfurtransferase